MSMNQIQLVALGNFQGIGKASIGHAAVLKGKEGHTRNADNIPVFIAIHTLVRGGENKHHMPLLFQFRFQRPDGGRNARYLWKIRVCK
ncbi:Uncharacterised protein [Chlamydia trachomatis]|nr:Uncharacterised protein [Chlamydia trachomatis]